MFGLQATAYGRELMFGLFEMKYINIRRRERRQKNREDGAGLYDRAVCAGTDEAHMLVRREDISAVSRAGKTNIYTFVSDRYVRGWTCLPLFFVLLKDILKICLIEP